MEKIEKIKTIISKSNSIVLFTGAGISVASGIPDFRSTGGIFSNKSTNDLSPEEILSNTFFNKNPKAFYEFYKLHLIHPNALPNIAHLYFSNLERTGKLKAIITQNIDNLHQASKSNNVIELHGSVYRNFCTKCMKPFSLDYILNTKGIPYCDKCNSIIKPDVTLYEEALDGNVLKKSIEAIESSDCLIIVGTSLVVYPAAGLIRYFNGENLILINKQRTPYDNIANLVINEDIIEVIKKIEE